MYAKGFWKSGHPPTLLMAFLYFDVSFMVWMVNAAMAPFISEQFGLSAAQKGLMLSVPVFAGAIFRIPLGLVAEVIGRKTAAMIGMALTIIGLLYGWLFVRDYAGVLVMGGFLGVAGASFAVALPLGAGWFPPRHQGLAMGIAGAGNSGSVLAGLIAPPLANAYGWSNVYGLAVIPVAVVLLLTAILAKEPPDRMERKPLGAYLKVLVEPDTWAFNLLYWVTFGGFVGFSSFLPTFFRDQYGLNKVQAGQFMTVVAFTASAVRILGGWLSDRIGGISALKILYVVIAAAAVGAATLPSLGLVLLLLFVLTAAMGAGNGAVFQLLPLRFPYAKAITTGIVGEFGALGGAFIPGMMGYAKQTTGSFANGFLVYAATALAAWLLLLAVQRRWTRSWCREGGLARSQDHSHNRQEEDRDEGEQRQVGHEKEEEPVGGRR